MLMEASVPPIRILPLGGCLLHAPLSEYGKLNSHVRASVGTGGSVRETYSFGEMIQFVRMLKGEIDIPPDVKEFAGMDARFRPLPNIGNFRDVDVVLVEPSTPVELIYGRYKLNRTAVIAHIVYAIRSVCPGPDVAKLTNTWLYKGMLGKDELIRSSLSADLVKLIPDSMPLADTARDVLLNVRAGQGDVATDLGNLHALIGRPMGVLTFVFQYLPDGRPVSWPAGFREEVLTAAAASHLPVFEPWRLVEQYGVVASLKDDKRHWKDEFMPTVSQAIVDFAASVIGEQPSASAVA